MTAPAPTKRNFWRRLWFGLALIVLGAAAAATASAYIVDRGWPKPLAGVVGALAFPVLPVAWHGWGERRRARARKAAKQPANSSLTGADRYWLRFGVVMLVVFGPMIYKSGRTVLSAPWRQGLWFVPAPKPGIGGIGLAPPRDFPDQESLLRRVPSDAEAVMVWHDSARDAVVALGGHQAMAVGRPTLGTPGMPGQALSLIGKPLGLEPAASVPNADGLELGATDGWRSKVEPPAGSLPPELRRELARSPATATVAIGLQPHTPALASLRAGALWGVVEGDSVTIEGRFALRDTVAAVALLDRGLDKLRAMAQGASVPACRAAIGQLADASQLALDDLVTVVVRATVASSTLADLTTCSGIL